MAGGMVNSHLTLNLFILVCPEKDVQAGKSCQEQDLGGAAEVPWLAHLGGEKAEGFPCHSLTFLKGPVESKVLFSLWHREIT